MAKKTAMTTPKEMLDALLLDCIDLDNGYLRCRHCRASSYPKEAMLHEDECVVGQILLRRVGAPAPAAHQERTEPQDYAALSLFFSTVAAMVGEQSSVNAILAKLGAALEGAPARAAEPEKIALLEGAIAAQDDREAQAGRRCGMLRERYGCDWPDAMAEEVLTLRAQREGAPARAAEWQPLLREELETHGWDNPDSNYCWWCQYDVNGTDGPKHPHGANCWGVRASALLALPPGALAGDSNSKK